MRWRQQAVKRMDGWRKRGGCHTFINQTHVFEHVHEAWSKAPGFVSVALKGADSDLGGALRGSSHHVDGVVHQSCFSLEEKRGRHHPSAVITNHVMHLSHRDCWCTCTRRVVSQIIPKNCSTTFTNYMKSNQPGNHNHTEHSLVSNFIQSTFLIVHTIRKQQGGLLYSDSSVGDEGLWSILCKGLVRLSKIGYVLINLHKIISQWLRLDL